MFLPPSGPPGLVPAKTPPYGKARQATRSRTLPLNSNETGEPVSVIYKIFRAAEWAETQAQGAFAGSPDDLRDGFIHFSSREQLEGTAARHFAGAGGLVLAEVDGALLGEALRWEESRGGKLFPHLYAALPLAAVTRTWPLPLVDGVHQFPKDVL